MTSVLCAARSGTRQRRDLAEPVSPRVGTVNRVRDATAGNAIDEWSNLLLLANAADKLEHFTSTADARARVGDEKRMCIVMSFSLRQSSDLH